MCIIYLQFPKTHLISLLVIIVSFSFFIVACYPSGTGKPDDIAIIDDSVVYTERGATEPGMRLLIIAEVNNNSTYRQLKTIYPLTSNKFFNIRSLDIKSLQSGIIVCDGVILKITNLGSNQLARETGIKIDVESAPFSYTEIDYLSSKYTLENLNNNILAKLKNGTAIIVICYIAGVDKKKPS